MNGNSRKNSNFPPALRVHADELEVLDHMTQRRLLAQVRQGQGAALLLNEATCAPEARRSFEAQVRVGRRATYRLISSNMRLVISVVANSRRRSPWLDRDDLIQEGVRGLTRAIEKFDLDRGTMLSTYATQWIRQSVQRAVMNGGLVRIPVHVQDGTASAATKACARRFDEIMSIEGMADELLAVESEFAAGCGPDECSEAGLELGPVESDIDDYINEAPSQPCWRPSSNSTVAAPSPTSPTRPESVRHSQGSLSRRCVRQRTRRSVTSSWSVANSVT